MAHAVSASYLRSDHMSPQAMALAFLLHALTALALWWMSMHRPVPPTESTIDVTIEQIKPPEPPAQPAPPPAPPSPPTQATSPSPQTSATPLGLPPPAPFSTEPPKPQPSEQDPPKPEPPKAEQQQALTPQATQPPAQPPPPALDKTVPPPAPPPAPPTSLDYPKPEPVPHPAPAAPKAPQPPQRAQTPPPQQAIRPSPLSQGHRDSAPPEGHASASPFHNPAADIGRTRAAESYIWQVVRKFSQHLPNMREKNEAGTVVARVAIGRDGRLLELTVAQSSGIPTLDRAVIEMIRVGAPYAPLPPELPGERFTFNVPIATKRVQ